MSQVFPRDVEDVVLTLCKDIATPRALTVSLLVKAREWDQLVSLRTDPTWYTDPISFKGDAAITGLLKKVVNLPTTVDRVAVAKDNFWKGERQCASTNIRLLPYLDGGYNHPADEGVYQFIEKARKIAARILGPCPDLIDGKFGPGATFGDRGQYTTVPDKMSSRPTLTTGAIWFLPQWAGTQWATACCAGSTDPIFIRGNRFTTVPKDCTKDRGIAVEPSINLFFQLGYGALLKSRLKRAGLDMKKAQDIHRQVACEASIRGHFATLDLSNASDTIAYSLVELLLPPRWFECLTALRSPYTQIDGHWVKLEKFSSMGNGFTFELETILFLTLCEAALESLGLPCEPGIDLFVYGDDIIVPTDSAAAVKAVLQYFGMAINETKSFVDGPFRESCGGDFFRGVSVRPYHLEELPYEPQHYIAMANGLRRMGSRHDYPDDLHHFARRAWFCVLDALPSHIRRLRGPEALGDLVIYDHQSRWITRTKHCIRYVQCYRPARYRKVAYQLFRSEVVLACATYGTEGGGRKGNAGSLVPRDSVLGYKVGWVPYS